MAVAVINSKEIKFAGAWAPKNMTVGALADGEGASHLIIGLFKGEGSLTPSAWPTPSIKFGGKTASLIGESLSELDIGGSQRLYVIEAPDPSGSLIFDTTTDFYVNALGISATFISGATSVGEVTTELTAKDATLTTSIDGGAGSLIFTHAFGVYMPSLTLTGGTPTPELVLSSNLAFADIQLRIYKQGLIEGGTASLSLTPPYNHSNAIVVEFLGTAGPAPKGVAPTSINSVNAVSNPTVVRLGPQSLEAVSIASTSAVGSHRVGGVSGDQDAVLSLLDQGDRYTVHRTTPNIFLDVDRVWKDAPSNSARVHHQLGRPYGVMVEPTTTQYITDSTGSNAHSGMNFPHGAYFYSGEMGTGASIALAGHGVEDGLPYLDIEFVFNNTSTSWRYPAYTFSAPTDIPALPGETWTLSAFVKIISGNWLRDDDHYPIAGLGINEIRANGDYLNSWSGTQPILPTDFLDRQWITGTVSNTNARALNPMLTFALPPGLNRRLVIRVAAPQLEKGPVPTSPILTSGLVPVTRPSEVMTLLLPVGTHDITVERVTWGGVAVTTVYEGQEISSGAWSLPSVNGQPYVRRVSYQGLSARPTAAESARAKGYLFGTAFEINDYNTVPSYAELIRREADIYCAEYEHKPDQLQPTEGSFAWGVGDEFYERAATDGKAMRGHALVWHVATPTWMHSAFATASTARWQSILDAHIGAVVARYPNMVSWDVVNELIEPQDGLTGDWRSWSLYNRAGPAFVAYAFQRARHYAPKAKLYLAEYGLEDNDPLGDRRRAAVLALLTNLVADGVPIDGLATQAHIDLERGFSRSKYAAFLRSVRDLGLSVSMTELDVRAPADDTTEQYNIRAGRRVREVLDVLVANTTGKEVLTWNLRDDFSWLKDDPYMGSRTQLPLPFNPDNSPKPIYAALQEIFEAAPRAADGPLSVAPGSLEPSGSVGSPTVSLAMIASQDIGATAIPSSASVGAISLRRGAVAVAPNAIPSSASVGAIGLRRGAVAVAPNAIPSSASVGAISLRRGAVAVAPSAIPSSASVGAVSLRTGGITVATEGIAPTETIGAPAVVAGAAKLIPDSITSALAFGFAQLNLEVPAQGIVPTATVNEPVFSTGPVAITVSPLLTAGAVGQPILSMGEALIAPAPIESATAFPTPELLTGLVGVSAESVVPASTVGEPIISSGDIHVIAGDIGSSEAFGSPAFSVGPVELSVSAIATDVMFGDPLIAAGGLILGVASIAPTADVSDGALISGRVGVLAASIPSAIEFGPMRITQHLSVMDGIGSVAVMPSPQLNAIRGIEVDPIAPASAVSEALFERLLSIISPVSLSTQAIVGVPSFNGANAIEVAGIATSVDFGLGYMTLYVSPVAPVDEAVVGVPHVDYELFVPSIAPATAVSSPIVRYAGSNFIKVDGVWRNFTLRVRVGGQYVERPIKQWRNGAWFTV